MVSVPGTTYCLMQFAFNGDDAGVTMEACLVVNSCTVSDGMWCPVLSILLQYMYITN